MCGIVGIYHLEGRPVEAARLTAMTGMLAHRGPDGEGIWHEGPVGLGHRRLAIRGLGAEGAQPMRDPGGRVVVSYNGEVYNDGELRRALSRETGYVFRTTCDTETLIAGWLAWGEAIFERLDGMFAVALWDRRQNKLVLARDPVGIKPLYLYRTGPTIAFASEIKGLLPALDNPPALNAAALHGFLAQGHVGPGGSLLTDVEQVMPGTVLTWNGEVWSERRFWRPARRPEIHRLDDAVAAFNEIWPRTVADMLVSEVPVGILQSGGIDSSLVTMAVDRSAGLPVFVAGFNEASHDETGLAEVVAAKAGATLIRVSADLEDDAVNIFRALVHHVDGQLADSSALAAYRLCAEVRRHVSVALSGDGADEFFAGYGTYAASRLAHTVRPFVPKSMAAGLGAALARLGGGDERRLPPVEILSRFLLGLSAPQPHCAWRQLLPSFLHAELAGPNLAAGVDLDPAADYAAAMGEVGAITDRCLLGDQSHYLPGDMLMKMDAMSMAHGLEIRVPFLSRAVMDLAGSIDAAVLYPRGGPPKAPLRRALAGMGLPSAITDGRKKGFNIPVNRFLRGPLRPLCEDLLDRRADALYPWLQPEVVRRLWRQHRDRQRRWGYCLWTILTFATWIDSREAISGAVLSSAKSAISVSR